MGTVTDLLEVALYKRNKAHRLARAAASLSLAEDRARAFQYAKFLEEEAAKIEAQADPKE